MKTKRHLVEICLLCTLALPAGMQAQFAFETNNGTITITGYTGPGGAVTIPSFINGLPVVDIGYRAFYMCGNVSSVSIPNSVTMIDIAAFLNCASLNSIIIPDSVTNINSNAFLGCSGLTNLTIGNGVTSIGALAFCGCTSLTSVIIPGSVTFFISDQAFLDCTSLADVKIDSGVTMIGSDMFEGCSSLTNVTIPGSVTDIEFDAFGGCSDLTAVYFLGNAPSGGGDSSIFSGESGTAYYLPGTQGWSSTFGGWPTALWYQPSPITLVGDYRLGTSSNGFGFTISGATNISVVVQVSTNLANPAWVPLATNILTGGSCSFSDPLWTNFPTRFYRIESQ